MGRIIIFTGKGGVGKTSVAAAHALRSAKEGKKTLLVSTDMAHNLSDVFGIRLGKEPEHTQENLDIYEIDPDYVMEHDFSSMMQAFEKMLAGGAEQISTTEVMMMPGMDELFALLKIAQIYKEGTYERIFVDCAPTGETLSLLKFPELLSWYFEKFFPVGKLAVRVLSPISKKLYKVELPDKKAMTDIQRLYLKMIELQELLKDREVSSIRLVAIPEKMVVEETKRNYMYMNLYNFHVDALFINRVLPDNLENDFFSEWTVLQRTYREELKECFQGVKVYEIPWYSEELAGVKALERISEEILNDSNIFAIGISGDREQFIENEKGYLLKLPLPGGKKENMDLYQSGTDIIIKIDNFKRSIPIPNVLRNYTVTGAKMENEVLSVQFELC